MTKTEKSYLYLLAFIIGLSFWHWPTFDPDLGWHLLGGKLTLLNGKVPDIDIINTFNQNWLDYHWLAQIIFFKIYNSFGYIGLQIFHGITCAFIGVSLLKLIFIIQKNNNTFLSSLIVLTICMLLLNEVSAVRPQIFAILIIINVFSLLLSNKCHKTELALSFLAAIVLCNMHVYWIFIPFLWLTLRVFPRYIDNDSFSLGYAWGGFLLIATAALLSPYGILPFGPENKFILANYALIWDYLLMPGELRNYINEMKPGLAGSHIIGLSFIFIVSTVIIYLREKSYKKNYLYFILFFISGILFIRGLKFVSIFTVLSTPIFTIAFHNLNFDIRFKKIATIFFFLLLAFFSYKTIVNFPTDESIQRSEGLPIEACSKIPTLNIQPRNGRKHVRVLTHFNYGGWCRWQMYEKDPNFDGRVTTDGRTQFVNPKHFTKQYKLHALKLGWFETLKKWDPDIYLVHIDTGLAQFLIKAQSNWKLVHQDNFFALFVPIAK